jgi:GNAT superfamily N-acetyltransferase
MTAGTAFSLRPAGPADEDFLFGIFVASRERELAPLPSEMRAVLAQQQYCIHKSGVGADFPEARQFILLAADSAPAGMVILAKRPGVLWVIDMALHPDHRNAGLGAALLQSLMDECRQSGRIMKGSVTPYNPARRLYARLGVTELGAEHGYIALEWRPGEDRR